MKKTYTFLIAALAAIMMMAQPKMVMGQKTTYTYELATSLSAGDEVVIVNTNLSYELTSISGNLGIASTITGSVVSGISGDYILTVEAGNETNSWSFKNGENYLAYTWTANSSNNYLTTVTTKQKNSSWTVSFNGSGEATITNCNKNTRNLRYNYNNGTTPRFCCYTSAQTAIKIYKRVEAKVATPTFSPAAGSYASPQNVTISTATTNATIYYTTDGETPTTSSSVYSSAISVSSDMTIKALAVKDGLTNSDVAEAAYSIVQPQNLTITSDHGTLTVTVNSSPVTPTNNVYSIPEGATVNLSVAAASGYAFTGWTVTLGGVTISNNSFTMPSNTVAITANYSQVKEDELTVSWTGVTNNTYTAWSGKSIDGGSGAVYAGKTNKNDNGIGFRTSGNAEGIVTTTSGGYVKKVSVTWKTSTNRTLEVYGKNSAYSAASDLFSSNSETQGTHLGSIIYGESTELTITGNYQFVGLRSKDGYLSVEPITITWQPVTMYSITCPTAYYIPETETQIGAVTVSKTSAPAGETINLTAAGMNHYHFNDWTVTDANSGSVTVSGTTTASFTMPASNVTVCAAWAEDTKYTITNGASTYITVDANSYAEETVAVQIHDVPTNKVVDKVTVTPASSSAFYATFTGQEAGNYNYSFTMPAENVTISVSFKEPEPVTVTYYVKGKEDSSVQVTLGNSVTLPTSTTTVNIDGYSLLGWCATEGSTTPLLTDSYTPEEDVSLYAVLGVTSNASLTITPSTSGLPTSYQTANTFVKYTLEGKDFYIQQGYKNGEKLQWRAAGNNNGTGTIYNNDNFGRILSIVIVYEGTDANHNFTMKAGTSANPSSGTTITQSYNSKADIGTFDLSGGNYTHFVMTNGSGAGYLKSITINYVASATVGTVTEIKANNASRDTDIESTECVVIIDGGILTFTGTNKGNASNIIIEDGGQLIHTNSVNATLKKGVLGYGDDPTVTTGWYTIASPANGAKVSLATTDTYDLFTYDEANHKWLNQKNEYNNITMFNQAQGFLYANSANQTLIYAGSMVGTNSTVSMDLSYAATGNSLIGYNLVGNPFSRELTSGQIKVGGTAITTYYVSEGGSNLTPRAIDDYPIKPGQGFFVQATDEDQQIVFNPASKDYSYNKPAYISIEAGNSEFTDMAYVQLGEGNTLRKMSINDNTSLVYVMQDGKDYASTTVEAYKASIPVNFKAAKTGIYTINVKTTGVDMDYLHLIDRYTGEDIDLLLESKYSFLASKGDDESRFILVFTANDANINANDDIFAYQNGNNIIISGEGELQIFDVMGRMVSTQNVSGTETISVNAQGVYIFRLVGSEIKTQKIVVR